MILLNRHTPATAISNAPPTSANSVLVLKRGVGYPRKKDLCCTKLIFYYLSQK